MKGVDKRQYDRKPCNHPGSFIGRDGLSKECTILNVSLGGLCVSTTGGLALNEVVGFVTPSFEARVIWTRRNIAGRNVAGLSFVQAAQ